MNKPDIVILDGEEFEGAEPTEEQIREYAEFLDLDLDEYPDLKWIAKEGVSAKVPHPWKACTENGDDVFYFNFETGESAWDHPCDERYLKMVKEYKEKRAAGQSGEKTNGAPENVEQDSSTSGIEGFDLAADRGQNEHLQVYDDQEAESSLSAKCDEVELVGQLSENFSEKETAELDESEEPENLQKLPVDEKGEPDRLQKLAVELQQLEKVLGKLRDIRGMQTQYMKILQGASPIDSVYDVKLKNVGLMEAECGYDITIVCTSDAQQAAFWKTRLEAAKGVSVPRNSTVLAVDEDWPGGAGNFLGTLYAWRKANLAMMKLKRNLKAELEAGASVALFHTAGKGTRLAPLPGSENNNKPGVKLPAVSGGSAILECVIRQTGAYAKSRPGRLSVFWGDQIFVPSVAAEYTPRHHVDIACALGPMPDAEEWARRGNQNYGLIAASSDNSVIAMLEKVTHADATAQLAGKASVDRVGTSLGSFSLSALFLAALDAGFADELASKSGKMDTDPHVWMPMTLSADAYASLAVKKGLFDYKGACDHHQRVANIIANFKSDACPGGMFGAVNVGLDMSWWDFGLLKLYRKNALLLTESTQDAGLARKFFNIAEEKRIAADCVLGDCQVDKASVVSATRAASGSVVSSILADVYTKDLRADGAVLMNVYARRIVAAKGAVAYNIVDDSPGGVVLGENEVRVGVFTLDSKGYFEMRSNVEETDGGKAFKDRVHGNALSFQEVYDLNHGTDVTACAQAAVKRRDSFRKSNGLVDSVYDVKLRNVGLMEAESGYDITIVCTSDAQQAAFWQARLDAAKGVSVPRKSTVLAVDEDWPGGAGNFLGTLYAWRKANLAMKKLGRDLKYELAAGASVALFHTAGKGTRLAPLPGSENNNKPGVKLPAVSGGIAILECVIRQTGAYAKSRPGRLSVFWGDQIFVPSVAAEYTPRHHVDIACALGPMPDAQEWARRGNQNYGLIAASSDNSVIAMLEKVTHADATAQLAGKASVDRVGTSLGSFSLSAQFLAALDAGFADELASKTGKMDTDPHVWMPMTLSADAYASLAVKKGLFDYRGACNHHRRVANIIASFKSDVLDTNLPASKLEGMFGAVNVGLEMSWWDFGLLKLYRKNALLLTESTQDADLARKFFNIGEKKRIAGDCMLGKCRICPDSVVSATRATSGHVASSIVADVCTTELCAEGAVLMNVYARRVVAAKGAVAYNIVDDSPGGVILGENEVRVGVFTLDSQGYFEMRSNVEETDGGKAFKDRVHGNTLSFQEVYDLNHGTDVTACAKAAVKRRKSFEKTLAMGRVA